IAGSPGPVNSVRVDHNRSVNDKTFIFLVGGTNVVISANRLTTGSASFGDAGSAIYVGGGSDVGGSGSDTVKILQNVIRTNHFAGIAVRGDADDIMVRGNIIGGTTRGIDVNSTAAGAATVRNNRVRNVGEFGIYLRAGTSQNHVDHNN